MHFLVDQLLARGTSDNLRKCSNCSIKKPLTSFTIKNKAKGYLDTRCKPCKSTLVLEILNKKKCLDL